MALVFNEPPRRHCHLRPRRVGGLQRRRALRARSTKVGVIVLRNVGGGAVNVGQIAMRAIDMLVAARKQPGS
jgi:hypothetical protein